MQVHFIVVIDTDCQFSEMVRIFFLDDTKRLLRFSTIKKIRTLAYNQVEIEGMCVAFFLHSSKSQINDDFKSKLEWEKQ